MGKVLTFRGAGENCTNCWYYTPHRNDHSGHAGSSIGYCRHPARINDTTLTPMLIKQLGLTCNPGKWCPKYVHVDSPAMKKLQFISGIKFVLLCMQQRLKGHAANIEKVEEYRELVDQLYRENKKLMTINQYKAAKRDPQYFASLIEELAGYYAQKSKNRGLS
ncbi:MAG TPA: hypothetical protein DDY17_06875 [Syntrophaceae bacterium]|jgi:hypothetical protein|nr:hypothetical protein [Syntrophaceae bacterium]